MKRLGGVPAGGIERRNVVEVPKERMASPGAESAMTVAGLSPVNGATTQPGHWLVECGVSLSHTPFTEGIPGSNPHRSTHQV